MVSLMQLGKYKNLNIMYPTTYGNYLLLLNILSHIIVTYNYTREHILSKKTKSNKLSWGILKSNESISLIYTIIFVLSQTFVSIVLLNKSEFVLANVFLLVIAIKATTPFVKDFSSIWCYMGAICVMIYTFYKLIII